ncbi:hypothetical protein [Cohnella rhizosphaerae]|uniref:Uncharacterized protein n=1 Tax=Cohnella rhizosphaerae TaxID=1457232 RepID=A0A9X4QR90_9BACL|nr:hypothetical protein [Cohnella rhizosphaerae]MDG0808003.1 hypothetical protein [Cohnella rhizosphaerae]
MRSKRDAQVRPGHYVVVREGNDLVAHCAQKRFPVELIGILLTVHVPYVRAEAFNFEDEFDVQKNPDKVAKVGYAPPIHHLVLGMQSVEIAAEPPPYVFAKQLFRLPVSAFKPASAFPGPPGQMVFHKRGMRLLEVHHSPINPSP